MAIQNIEMWWFGWLGVTQCHRKSAVCLICDRWHCSHVFNRIVLTHPTLTIW